MTTNGSPPDSGVPEGLEPIYVASRASIPERGQMWRDFRSQGVCITSSWIDEDGEGQTADFGELWLRIVNEIASAAALVLYAKRDDFPLKGALTEAGVALGMGKPVIVCLPDLGVLPRNYRPIGSWIAHPLVTRCDDVRVAVKLATSTRRASVVGPQKDAEWIAETTAREYVAKSLLPEDAKLELNRNDYWQRAKGAETVLERIRAATQPPITSSTTQAGEVSAAPVVDDADKVLLEALRRVRADEDDFWTFYQADPLMVKAADRIEELLRWHGTEQSMHAAWRKRAEEAEVQLTAAAPLVAPVVDRALYSELIHIAAELVRANGFLPTCAEDMKPRLKRADILKTAEAQEQQLKDWAYRVRRVADNLSVAAPLPAPVGDAQTWCDHCSADLNGVRHILCERYFGDTELAMGGNVNANGVAAIISKHFATAPTYDDAALTRAALAFAKGQEMTQAELANLKERLAVALRAAS